MNEMITIPRAEYDRLVQIAEDAADARAIETFRASLASGSEELIPAEYANRIIDGESPVRVYREYRGLSGARLAALAGMHRVQVRDIETGKSRGSIDTLGKLAAALGVTIDDLV